MNSKEEIYDKYMQIFWNGGSEEKVEDVAMRAMDEWGKKESIEFSEWCQEKGWEKHIGETTWFNRMGYVTEYSTDQLYELFSHR